MAQEGAKFGALKASGPCSTILKHTFWNSRTILLVIKGEKIWEDFAKLFYRQKNKYATPKELNRDRST